MGAVAGTGDRRAVASATDSAFGESALGAGVQRESYDHCVRDEDELERIVAYVHGNPVVPGLVERAEEYRYSSAREFTLREGRAR